MKIGRAALMGTVAAVLALAGCSSSTKTKPVEGSPAVYNDKCPIMGSDVDKSITTDYHDKKVAFCCDGCETKFNKMTDAQKDAALAKAKAK